MKRGGRDQTIGGIPVLKQRTSGENSDLCRDWQNQEAPMGAEEEKNYAMTAYIQA